MVASHTTRYLVVYRRVHFLSWISSHSGICGGGGDSTSPLSVIDRCCMYVLFTILTVGDVCKRVLNRWDMIGL